MAYPAVCLLAAMIALSACKPSGDATQRAEPPPPPMRETLPEPHPPVQVVPAKPASGN